MGSGGVRASCQATLCVLAGIGLGLALLCLLCGGVVYGVSRTFTKISETHLVNRTTASNFTKSVDAKLDDLRSGSAEKGVMLMETAYHLFYSAGALGVASAAFLSLACLVAYTSRPALAPPVSSGPYALAPPVSSGPDAPAPPGPPGPDAPAPPTGPLVPSEEDAEGDATSPAGPGSPPPPPAPEVPVQTEAPIA